MDYDIEIEAIQFNIAQGGFQPFPDASAGKHTLPSAVSIDFGFCGGRQDQDDRE
jgi:hypothetical protein